MAVDASILTTANAAALLGVQPQTMRVWRLRGTGPTYIRYGGPSGRVVYRRADIDAWLAARTFTSTSTEKGNA